MLLPNLIQLSCIELKNTPTLSPEKDEKSLSEIHPSTVVELTVLKYCNAKSTYLISYSKGIEKKTHTYIHTYTHIHKNENKCVTFAVLISTMDHVVKTGIYYSFLQHPVHILFVIRKFHNISCFFLPSGVTQTFIPKGSGTLAVFKKRFMTPSSQAVENRVRSVNSMSMDSFMNFICY